MSRRAMIGFIDNRGNPDAYLTVFNEPLYVAEIAVYVLQTLIGDSFIVCARPYYSPALLLSDVLQLHDIYLLRLRNLEFLEQSLLFVYQIVILPQP